MARTRRFDPDRVLVARIIGAAQHGDTPAELVAIATGRVEILERSLVRLPTEFDHLVDFGYEDRIRAAVASLK